MRVDKGSGPHVRAILPEMENRQMKTLLLTVVAALALASTPILAQTTSYTTHYGPDGSYQGYTQEFQYGNGDVGTYTYDKYGNKTDHTLTTCGEESCYDSLPPSPPALYNPYGTPRVPQASRHWPVLGSPAFDDCVNSAQDKYGSLTTAEIACAKSAIRINWSKNIVIQECVNTSKARTEWPDEKVRPHCEEIYASASAGHNNKR